MSKNKLCNEIKQSTPEIIREWETEIKGDVFLIRRFTGFYCPLQDKFVPEKTCRNCSHNYGAASAREIYCAPNMVKARGARSQRKDLK